MLLTHASQQLCFPTAGYFRQLLTQARAPPSCARVHGGTRGGPLTGSPLAGCRCRSTNESQVGSWHGDDVAVVLLVVRGQAHHRSQQTFE